MEIEDFKRFNDVDPFAAAKFFLRRLADDRVHMNGIDRLDVGVLIHNAADGTEHMVHRLAEVFATVRCQNDQSAVRRPFKLGVCIIRTHGSG